MDTDNLPLIKNIHNSGWYEASSSSTNLPVQPPAFEIMEGVRVYPSKDKFRFGNCATIAICQAFDIPFNAFVAICRAMKIKTDETNDDSKGLSFFECKRIIHLLSDSCKCTSKYIPNTGKVTYAQMLLLLNKGKYLVMFNIHLSFAQDGEIYDSYFRGFNENSFKKTKPTGWWKIN